MKAIFLTRGDISGYFELLKQPIEAAALTIGLLQENHNSINE